MQNKNYRVIVPINAVDTYDLGIHNGDLVNIMALYNMIINGVEVVRNIEAWYKKHTEVVGNGKDKFEYVDRLLWIDYG